MTPLPHLDPFEIERNARRLRARELARMAGEVAVKWASLKERLWLALARRALPDSPVTPNG